MQPIDFREVRRLISLEAVLRHMNWHCRSRFGHTAYGPCPLRCSDYARVCSVDFNSNLWCCHHCFEGGNQLDLWSKYQGMATYTAALSLCKELGFEVPYLK